MSDSERPTDEPPDLSQISGSASFISFNVTGQLKGFKSPRLLLHTAEQLHAAGYHDAAVIVAYTACEVIAEHVLSKEYPADRTKKFVRSYALTGEKRLKQYKKLTGDKIDAMPFWAEYLRLETLRHEAIHQGIVCGPVSCREGLEAAKKLVDHVAQHNGLIVVATFPM